MPCWLDAGTARPVQPAHCTLLKLSCELRGRLFYASFCEACSTYIYRRLTCQHSMAICSPPGTSLALHAARAYDATPTDSQAPVVHQRPAELLPGHPEELHGSGQTHSEGGSSQCSQRQRPGSNVAVWICRRCVLSSTGKSQCIVPAHSSRPRLALFIDLRLEIRHLPSEWRACLATLRLMSCKHNLMVIERMGQAEHYLSPVSSVYMYNTLMPHVMPSGRRTLCNI